MSFPRTVGALSACLMLVTACEPDDILNPERSGDAFATLVTPNVEVAGALFELTGVTQVVLTDGEVIARRNGDVLRVAIFLDEPGTLDFGVVLTSDSAEPSGTVIDVIDADDRMVASMVGYHLEIER